MLNGSPHGSDGKESTCNAGDLHQDSIDQGLGPPIGFRCWLKVQVVTCVSDLLSINQKFSIYKSEPRETWVWFLGWENPLEKGTATHSSIVVWRIPWTEEPWRVTIHGVADSDVTGQLSLHFTSSRTYHLRYTVHRIYNCPEVNLERLVGPLRVYWTQFQCVEGVPSLTNSFCDTNWVSNNSNHSGTTYLEAASDSIDQGLAPPTGFRCWLKVQLVICVSDLLSINQKFPWWHFWVWFIC